MARNKLSKEQRLQVLTWIAADYDTQLIRQWMEKRKWPKIGCNTLYIYRRRYAIKIEELRKQRLSLALTTGLALKEERVTRLKDEADLLEAKKWEYDWNSGRLWNEKAWRETIQQIADEMEPKRNEMEHSGTVTHRIEFSEAIEKVYGKYHPDTLPDSD
jgi:hypothetical protein